MNPTTCFLPSTESSWPYMNIANQPQFLGATSPSYYDNYIQGLPVVLEGIINFNRLRSLLLASVATKDVDFAFKDHGEACGSARLHWSNLPPFF